MHNEKHRGLGSGGKNPAAKNGKGHQQKGGGPSGILLEELACREH